MAKSKFNTVILLATKTSVINTPIKDQIENWEHAGKDIHKIILQKYSNYDKYANFPNKLYTMYELHKNKICISDGVYYSKFGSRDVIVDCITGEAFNFDTNAYKFDLTDGVISMRSSTTDWKIVGENHNYDFTGFRGRLSYTTCGKKEHPYLGFNLPVKNNKILVIRLHQLISLFSNGLIALDTIGKYRTLDIHHRTYDTYDNSIKNLNILTRNDHARLNSELYQVYLSNFHRQISKDDWCILKFIIDKDALAEIAEKNLNLYRISL